MNSKPILIQNGYSSCAGVCSDGWYVGTLIIDDVDEAFLSGRDRDYEQAKENCRHWQEAVAHIRRRVVLVQEGGDTPLELALADLICGPVCPKEKSESPILAWTQRVFGVWNLKCHFQGQTHTILQSRSVMRNPQVAESTDGLVLAFERDIDSSQGEVVLLNSNGTELFRTAGRNPKMVASSKGLVLMTEQCSRNSISLLLQEIVNGSEVRRIEIDGGDDYTFNGDMACSPYSDAVVVVAESCPAFGMDCRVGMHRDLKVWRWEDTGALADISGVDERMPIERRAFNYWSTENMAPIRPIVFFDDNEPVVAFRQFRHFVFKTFGWDVCICRWGSNGWDKPARVSESLTTPDTGYGIVSVGGRYVSAFPCLDNPGTHTRCSNHRVEITEFAKDHSLPPIEVPEDKQDTYFIITGYKDIAAPPPPLDEPCKERVLIWGDLHQHTDYSKCVSAMDGWPGEMFRYARDVLGCRVFTFMDHSPTMSGPENTWLNDQLEILTGDYGIPLFGSEPGTSPGRHTNWYSYDREVYDRLRCILDIHKGNRQRMYRQTLEDLPLDTVLALRHFHGNMMDDDEIVQSFEPQLEVAMEAMQGRTNALMRGENAMVNSKQKAPFFPNQFLNAGFKLGLVGGTDHYRGRGPNHFCMTGFWVKEISAAGVWEALRNRYTIAMSDAKIAMSATMDGCPMGSAVSAKRDDGVNIRVSVSCFRKIVRAALIRDGETLPWVEVDANRATLELTDPAPTLGRHWYVPTVEVETAYGDDNTGYGHTSPFFVIVKE